MTNAIIAVLLFKLLLVLVFFALSSVRKIQNANLARATERVNEVHRRVMAESIAKAYGKP